MGGEAEHNVLFVPLTGVFVSPLCLDRNTIKQGQSNFSWTIGLWTSTYPTFKQELNASGENGRKSLEELQLVIIQRTTMNN